MTRRLLALALASSSLPALPALAQEDATTTNEPVSAAGGNYRPRRPVGSGNGSVEANVGRTDGHSDGGFGSDAGSFIAPGAGAGRTDVHTSVRPLPPALTANYRVAHAD